MRKAFPVLHLEQAGAEPQGRFGPCCVLQGAAGWGSTTASSPSTPSATSAGACTATWAWRPSTPCATPPTASRSWASSRPPLRSSARAPAPCSEAALHPHGLRMGTAQCIVAQWHHWCRPLLAFHLLWFGQWDGHLVLPPSCLHSGLCSASTAWTRNGQKFFFSPQTSLPRKEMVPRRMRTSSSAHLLLDGPLLLDEPRSAFSQCCLRLFSSV